MERSGAACVGPVASGGLRSRDTVRGASSGVVDHTIASLAATPVIVQWFAIQTRSRQERIVARELARHGLEAFLPLVRLRRRWSDRIRVVETPLFPGYVFVRCEATDRRAATARGSVRVVGVNGTPSAIPSDEIDAIRAAAASSVLFEPLARLVPGQAVEVIRGPLAGFEGTLVRRGEKYRLVIVVPLLGRGIAADVDSADVVPA